MHHFKHKHTYKNKDNHSLPAQNVREASGDDIGANVIHVMDNMHSEETSTWSSEMGTMLVGRKQCFD
jgi:hypothetical protein